ncbi:MAG TPA: ATP-grasp domain-containing protein [Candidatus Limnocylindrales bacterium]|nr:ATP-grasp domain-containing protein [Candidatus Limnocylindrales bacterium]
MPSATGSSPLPVLIFGPHIAALGVLRALARRGVTTYVVDDTRNVIVRSRWYRPAPMTLRETSDPAILADYLRSLDIPRAVLIACSDSWALAVSGLPDDLRERFPSSIAPHAAIERFVDKDRFRELTGDLDLPRPRSIPIANPGDLDAISDEDLRTGFLKPTESQANNRAFRTKGFFIESRAHARGLVEEGAAAGVTFMLQEYIPGDTTKTFLIDGFVDRHGTISAMVARRRLRMDPPKLANTCSDVTIPLAELDACLPTLRTLLEAVAYRGIFNVEFKLDERDGRFKIIELNPRPFWLIGHIARAGADLPWMSYLDAQGLPLPAAVPYQVGRFGLYEIPDATAIVRAIGSRRRPHGPVLRSWLFGDKALFWWNDPMPALAAVGQLVARRLARARDRVGDRSAPSTELSEASNPAVPAR